jgi:hypothetical protein
MDLPCLMPTLRASPGINMNRLAPIAFCVAILAAPALAAEPLETSDFFLVAGLTAKTTIREAQSAYGLGFINGQRTAVAFSTSGRDGGTYRMNLTAGSEVQFDCGWLETEAPNDSLNTLCKAANEDVVRQLLSRGKDRNAYLRLIGAKLKGVQVDFGRALVTVTMSDPAKPPNSVTIAWCNQSGCGGE